jgi:hypothetical protein
MKKVTSSAKTNQFNAFLHLMKNLFSSLFAGVLLAVAVHGQEFGTWQSSPSADMATFQANLAAPAVSQSGGKFNFRPSSGC